MAGLAAIATTVICLATLALRQTPTATHLFQFATYAINRVQLAMAEAQVTV